ncbi:MAG: hypothetical protein AAFO95_18060 [Cyanobacteria bacterium J06600_6]
MKSIYLRYGKNILDDAVNFLSEAKGYEQQLIILDQLEVVFYSDERSEFFENLSELIQNSSNCKYILSFREEVLAGVETQIGVYFNYYNKFRLEHLKINGVVEAIQGASLDPVCRSYYNLSEPVESEVEYIARDIIQEQQGNIIAPLLQFTLRKIWDGRKSDSEQIDGTPFCITQEAYQKNKYQGIKALVKECFEKIRENCLEDYESGLIFDILDFFISPELTSRSRTFKELIEVYGHIKARQFVTDGHDTKKSKYDAPHILTLCQYMKECFLLQQIDDNTFRLSHDSLAPTIAQFINQSQLEGQLVRRFLVSAVDKHYRLNIEQLLIILQASNSYRKLSQEELLAISRYKKIYSRSIIQSHLQHNDYGKAIDLMKSVFVDDRMSSNLRQLQIINYHLESVKKFSRMGLLSDPEENLLLTDLGKSLLGLTNRIPIFPVNADDDHFWTGLSILEQGNLFNAIELYAANLMYRVDQESRDDLIELVQRASTVQRKLVSRFSQVYKEKSGPQISKLLASLLDILYNLYQGQFKSDNFFDYISKLCRERVFNLRELPIHVQNEFFNRLRNNSNYYIQYILRCYYLIKFVENNGENIYSVPIANCVVGRALFAIDNLVLDLIGEQNQWSFTHSYWLETLFSPFPTEDILLKAKEEPQTSIFISALNDDWHSFLMSQTSSIAYIKSVRVVLTQWIDDLFTENRAPDLTADEFSILIEGRADFERSFSIQNWLQNIASKISKDIRRLSSPFLKAVLVFYGTFGFLNYLKNKKLVSLEEYSNLVDILRGMIGSFSYLQDQNSDFVGTESPELIFEMLSDGKLYEAAFSLNSILDLKNIVDPKLSHVLKQSNNEQFEDEVLATKDSQQLESTRVMHAHIIVNVLNELLIKEKSEIRPPLRQDRTIDIRGYLVNTFVQGNWDDLYPYLREQLITMGRFEDFSTLSECHRVLRESKLKPEIEKIPALYRELLQLIFSTSENQKRIDLGKFYTLLVTSRKVNVSKLLDLLLSRNTVGYQLLEGALILRKIQEIEQKFKQGIIPIVLYFDLIQKETAMLFDFCLRYSTQFDSQNA